MGSTGEFRCPLVASLPNNTPPEPVCSLLSLLSLLFLCSHHEEQQERVCVPRRERAERAEREQREVVQLLRGRNAAPGKDARRRVNKRGRSLTTAASRPTLSKLKILSDYCRFFFNPCAHPESQFSHGASFFFFFFLHLIKRK